MHLLHFNPQPGPAPVHNFTRCTISEPILVNRPSRPRGSPSKVLFLSRICVFTGVKGRARLPIASSSCHSSPRPTGQIRCEAWRNNYPFSLWQRLASSGPIPSPDLQPPSSPSLTPRLPSKPAYSLPPPPSPLSSLFPLSPRDLAPQLAKTCLSSTG